MMKLDDREWKAFTVEELFTRIVSTKGNLFLVGTFLILLLQKTIMVALAFIPVKGILNGSPKEIVLFLFNSEMVQQVSLTIFL